MQIIVYQLFAFFIRGSLGEDFKVTILTNKKMLEMISQDLVSK
jgi:hypothetical protein